MSLTLFTPACNEGQLGVEVGEGASLSRWDRQAQLFVVAVNSVAVILQHERYVTALISAAQSNTSRHVLDFTQLSEVPGLVP